MKVRLLSFFLIACAAVLAPAQDAVTNAPAAPAKPARRGFPPEAFTTPSNFVALVNVGGAVDQTWLEEQAGAMQRSLQVGVKAAAVDQVESGAAGAAALFAEHPDWKLAVVLLDAEGLSPILASPYEGWVFMDAGWVKRGGGDEALVRDRMGKRIYQALGALCGAAYHPEREAVMRYSPSPAALDDCLSHNFHPLNSNAFSIVARAVGLDPVRLRPRSELVEMGILKPRPTKKP